MDKKTEPLKELTQTLLGYLGVIPKEIKVSAEDGDGLRLELAVAEQDSGVLIGYHGETIAGLQLLLNLMLYQKTGEWTRLVVDIGDYRKKRKEYLESLAKDTAAKVVESGEPLALYNLNPFERRTVHMVLADLDGVVTESQGEGKNRFLVVSPKNG